MLAAQRDGGVACACAFPCVGHPPRQRLPAPHSPAPPTAAHAAVLRTRARSRLFPGRRANAPAPVRVHRASCPEPASLRLLRPWRRREGGTWHVARSDGGGGGGGGGGKTGRGRAGRAGKIRQGRAGRAGRDRRYAPVDLAMLRKGRDRGGGRRTLRVLVEEPHPRWRPC